MRDADLWTVAAMAEAMKARAHGPLPESVGGISIDSRTLASGDAFFAIKGDSRDGHDFVAAALAAKAGLAVVAEKRRKEFGKYAPLLVVKNVLTGLRQLARAARSRSQAAVIGVTGSVGKTGTKEALGLALSRSGKTHVSTASYNNHWGVPLSLARCPADASFAVFEMGMNHVGEIAPLSRLVRPHIAIITAIAPVHLAQFKSVAGIADAKSEIFAGLQADGVAIVNRDTPHFERIRRNAKRADVARIVGFGEHADAQARVLQYALQPSSSTVHADILGQAVTYKLGAPGKHLVLNSLAVLAAASLAGADLALAALALADLRPAGGRGTRIALALPGGEALLIDESYNANPVSMRAALALLGQAETGGQGRRIAVLGDMLELGRKSKALHAELAEPVVENGVDLVFCAGPDMRALWDALPTERRGGYAESAKALEPQLLDAVRRGDAIMVKGSNGSRMALIVKALERLSARHIDDTRGNGNVQG
ncbi:MAG: UDP-N-acetylmuramoylalanyl-D-glutamyl-2,6-diaminopimelate--D-alanyl-D-alanine ligase [Alphaproteobacteria bacterium]|nr:UDP-N-acetylmuramoylalanyl-D-glutamyl-2,6-diaminopimelate--D-alanyl-D-alanine ligase [Alphaproteobacteria bacterium]